MGLGVVDIPIAQFCLNPVCDWYQDFAEAKEANDIKEDVLPIKVPSITKKLPELKKLAISQQLILLVIGLLIVIIGFLFVNSIIQFKAESGIQNQSYQNQSLQHDNEISRETPAVSAIPTASVSISASPTEISSSSMTPSITMTPVLAPVPSPKKYSLKITLTYGFTPSIITINRSDIIIWNNEENQRPRVILVSKDDLFNNRTMDYSEKSSYQFNQTGEYLFVISEYNPFNQSYREYPDIKLKVIVQ